MPRAVQFLVWVLAAMWLPATLHCAIDRAGLLPAAPVCCADEDAPTSQAEPCGTRCEPLDNGTQQIEQEPLRITAPAMLPVSICPLEASPPVFVCQISPAKADAPPELGRTWQFVARAALPPRAP